MSRIEKGISSSSTNKGLHALHQESREAEQSQLPAPAQPQPPTTIAPQLIPFAIVNSVAESSPAAAAVHPITS
jgi:hypothetical protein